MLSCYREEDYGPGTRNDLLRVTLQVRAELREVLGKEVASLTQW